MYIEEAIELNEDVTFLLLMPPPENVCTPPGSSDQFGGSHFSDTPIATFELCEIYFLPLSLSLSCAQFPLFFLLPLLLLLNFFFSFPSSSTVQLYTYQRPFMLRFAQVSARLDIELLITQKKRREVSCIYIVCKHVQYQHVV